MSGTGGTGGGNRREHRVRALSGGRARGRALVLSEPLSFWGGMDPASGRVSDVHHPQHGEVLSRRVLVMPSGRGSSSSSSVLAEAIRAGTAPRAIVLAEPDPIVALGAVVAGELYGRACPVVVAEPEAYASIGTGDEVAVVAGHEQGTLEVRRRVSPRPGPPGDGRSRGRT